MDTMAVFDLAPSVELLQWLAPGSLKQNLAKGVRLWVILRSIYGEDLDEVNLNLGQKFTYPDWRDRFFSDPKEYHLDRDRQPSFHEPCRCTQSLNQWLFDSDLSLNSETWKQAFLQVQPMTEKALEEFLDSESRLFGTTGKNLQHHFQTLVDRHFLIKEQENFYKVEELPVLLETKQSSSLVTSNLTEQFIQTELGEIADYFSEPINGIQRFFFYVEYIISAKLSEQIQNLQIQLKSIWEKASISPIKLTYSSAKFYEPEVKLIVYPVCIYYWQRAPYLLAFGQTPEDENKIDWYDYRLDKISKLKELTWDKVKISGFDFKICQSKTPKIIQELMSEAWGFDFYQPKQQMMLRFDRYFYANYIKATERGRIFQKIDSHMAEIKVKNSPLPDREKRKIISQIQAQANERSPHIYCLIDYRENDNNVIMRLRAWGDKVEVILPQQLRQRMQQDLDRTWKLYQP
jgi:CRISPR-associated protein (TIGR03985 family)